MELEQAILKLIGRKDYTPLNVPQLLARLGLQPNQQQELQQSLRKLERSGQITRTTSGCLRLPRPKIRSAGAGAGEAE